MNITTKPYNKTNIKQTLDSLNLSQKGHSIITQFNNRIISTASVSDNYQLFDFVPFTKNIIEEIENYFQPETYKLKITKGQQELRLIGEVMVINGEKYQKMFNILNSTDKSRALQVNIGVIRWICSNGMVAATDEYSGLKVKHYKTTLPEKIKLFLNKLDQFNINIENQVTQIERLSNNFVSFKDIVGGLAINKNGIITPSASIKVRAFSKKMLNSETDKILNLQAEQTELLKTPMAFQDDKFKLIDIDMNAYEALNCYTEVFRNYDSSVIKRETKRILELVS